MTKRAATKAKPGKGGHPLMLNGKDWDRQKVIDIVCGRIATSSKSIAKILAAGWEGYNLPDYTTFMAWLREDDTLSHQYARAKDDQADFMADETLEIADDDVLEPVLVDGIPLVVDGKPVMARSNVAVQHAKLRVDTRKWLASKLKPKKYGDKLELGGSVGVRHEDALAALDDGDQ